MKTSHIQFENGLNELIVFVDVIELFKQDQQYYSPMIFIKG